MRKIVMYLLAAALMAGPAAELAVADWQPDDGHKMHFPQLPDSIGWDVRATFPYVLADDWTCSETGWVKDIHFWGSWVNGLDGEILQFELSIHADIPGSPPGMPYSRPGEELWKRVIPFPQFSIVPIDGLSWQGWYDPVTPWFSPNDHQKYYQYNVFLDSLDWFWQKQDTVYWLNISATVADPQNTQWGWKSSVNHHLDDAVWAEMPIYNWVDLWEPPEFLESLDLAFVITGGVEPIGACCYPGPTALLTKCVETTASDCINTYGGVYQGDGTSCGGRTEACCLSDGTCVIADALCCVNELGGVPQGPGTTCTAPEACCLSDGSCIDIDPLCCDEMGGTPQGLGTACSAATVACCLTNGSCVDVDPLCCDDLGGFVSPYSAMCLGDGNGNTIDDACEAPDTCTYYKPAYPDYAPAGMPDFDQKQDNWVDSVGNWSHCGPVALANCLWWFDSKYESNTSPPPPTVSDSYPLVSAYGVWDDHGTQNVLPFVDSLALYCRTNSPGQTGTNVFDLAKGAIDWMDSVGLAGKYTVVVHPAEPGVFDFEAIRSEVLASQDVILLLGFYQDLGGGYCEWIGGHFVTIAGVCVDPADSTICISDPFIDKNEGGPPPPHGPGVHNDAAYVSGPHGTMHHDSYDVIVSTCQFTQPPLFHAELSGYPVGPANVGNFYGQNAHDPTIDPIPPQPGVPVHTVIEYAVVICPDTTTQPTGACCYPGAAGNNSLCTVTTQDSCINVLGGLYQGDGTVCGSYGACCLPNGTCIDADSLCCVDVLGGIPQSGGAQCTQPEACCLSDGSCIMIDPLCCDEMGGIRQGPGTQCTQPEACCLSNGSCVMADPLCCDEMGGIAQGPGTACSANTIACCLPDGSCIDVDPLCCDEMGGTPSPVGAASCLGDGNGNGIDDACEVLGACCWTDGTCTMETPADCQNGGGDYKGDGTHCLGDINNNGIDDICEDLWPGHKMHYPQLPDEAGWDVYATADPDMAVNLADDWMCTETGWVKDLHWWGSWRGGLEAPILLFALRIWSNIPADQSPTGYSMPGDVLWERALPAEILAITSPTPEGWYNPAIPEIIPNDHQTYYRYDLILDSLDWFWQEEGNIYWLSISCAHTGPADRQWGWKSSKYHFMDDAVWGKEGEYGWMDIWEPPDFEVSLDLAFVITSGAQLTGACCYPDTVGDITLCIETTQDSCLRYYLGVYEGDGIQCGGGRNACCLPDGTCLDADSLCCVNELGGTPYGPDAYCGAEQACCLADGICANLDTLCCYQLGGTPQGIGTSCTGTTIACCLPSGECRDVEELCCDDLGGFPSPFGAAACLGDADGNGTDDACEIKGACCLTDGSCQELTLADCQNVAGDYKGDYTRCLGDINGNSIDDACEQWEDGDPHKMHYPQLPYDSGYDVNATREAILADDWLCTQTGWVKDIHFWGSWRHGITGIVDSFLISIHADIPADPPDVPYSRPGETLREFFVNRFAVTQFERPWYEGWYDAITGEVFEFDHNTFFQYDVYLPEADWFWQDSGTVYWLNISALVRDPVNTRWGWKSSKDRWNDDAVGAVWGNLDWVELYEPPLFDSSLDLSFVITGGIDVDTCTYYKPFYYDYAPYGMPDFDQKQDAWASPFNGNWSWCGPVALANCIWWFDSKFEATTSPPPPAISDSYPLISPYGLWDDHSPSNVMPFIQALAPTCNTDMAWPGTILWDLENGFIQWINNNGLNGHYSTYVVLGPEYEEVKDSILASQDVILLLGFYELLFGGGCHWIGGHYVTAAGVCPEDTSVCVSDPMLDGNEGEPPAGTAHGSGVHNDARNVSGPHGTIHHDKYHLTPATIPICPSLATWQFTDYPNSWPDVMVFENENPIDPPSEPVTYYGGEIIVLLDAALIICPAEPCDCVPGDANNDGTVNVGDAVYVINFVFKMGPPPVPYRICSGDANCDCVCNVGDAVYIVNYVFKKGPPPCDCLTWLALCGAPLRK